MLPTMIPLADFEVHDSDDPGKDVPALVHRLCGKPLCAVEPHDTLESLIRTAISHQCATFHQ
jgi:hypothetical protein